jgi:hypothetical protein
MVLPWVLAPQRSKTVAWSPPPPTSVLTRRPRDRDAARGEVAPVDHEKPNGAVWLRAVAQLAERQADRASTTGGKRMWQPAGNTGARDWRCTGEYGGPTLAYMDIVRRTAVARLG